MFNLFGKKGIEPQQLPISTDMHCHVVPGIDDGSPDATTSADLIERMQGWGITRIVASPHVTKATFENTPQTIAPALQALRDELQRRGNNIPVDHSAEYRMDEFFEQQFAHGLLRPYPGTSYLLVENSFSAEPFNIETLLFQLQCKGYQPILAHPERYHYYHGNRARYQKLHQAGTLFQVNVLSLAGHYGKAEREMAEWLIEQQMVDFLGTDLHNHAHADSIDAYLRTKACLKHAQALRPRLRNDQL